MSNLLVNEINFVFTNFLSERNVSKICCFPSEEEFQSLIKNETNAMFHFCDVNFSYAISAQDMGITISIKDRPVTSSVQYVIEAFEAKEIDADLIADAILKCHPGSYNFDTEEFTLFKDKELVAYIDNSIKVNTNPNDYYSYRNIRPTARAYLKSKYAVIADGYLRLIQILKNRSSFSTLVLYDSNSKEQLNMVNASIKSVRAQLQKVNSFPPMFKQYCQYPDYDNSIIYLNVSDNIIRHNTAQTTQTIGPKTPDHVLESFIEEMLKLESEVLQPNVVADLITNNVSYQNANQNILIYNPKVKNIKERLPDNLTHNYYIFGNADALKKTYQSDIHRSNRTCSLGFLMRSGYTNSYSKFWADASSKIIDNYTVSELVDKAINNYVENSVFPNVTTTSRFCIQDLNSTVETVITAVRRNDYRPIGDVESFETLLNSICSITWIKSLNLLVNDIVPLINREEIFTSKTAVTYLRSYYRQELIRQVQKLYDIYEAVLGGEVDTDYIQDTKFADYYEYLNASQKTKLRTYMNQGTVNADVLNNQPLTVWLILSLGYSLNRIKGKKTKIFDALAIDSAIPKWIINKLLAPLEEVTEAKLDSIKNLFKAMKETWGDNESLLWIIEKEPKIFADLTLDELASIVMFANHSNAIVAKHSVVSKINTYYSYYLRNVDFAPQNVITKNVGTGVSSIYTIYEKAYKEAKKNNTLDDFEREWKTFAINFRDFIRNIIAQASISISDYRIKKKHSSEVENKGDYYNRTALPQNPIHSANDFLVRAIYLYALFTGHAPTHDWNHFTAFIWQCNEWVEDSKRYWKLQNARPNAIQHTWSTVNSTEAYLGSLIQEQGRGHIRQDNRYNRRENHDNPTIYSAVMDMWPHWVAYPRDIVVEKGMSIDDMRANQYTPLSGVSYIELPKFNCKVQQILTQLDLTEEGKHMHHCVGGYHTQCSRGTDIIFHISPLEKPDNYVNNMESTLQWRAGQEDSFTQGQHYSYHNSRVHDNNSEAAKWLLSAYNKTIKSDQYKLFMQFLKLLDNLAQELDFIDFQSQLHSGKKFTEEQKKLKEKKSAYKDKVLSKLNIGKKKDDEPVPARDENIIEVQLI